MDGRERFKRGKGHQSITGGRARAEEECVYCLSACSLDVASLKTSQRRVVSRTNRPSRGKRKDILGVDREVRLGSRRDLGQSLAPAPDHHNCRPFAFWRQSLLSTCQPLASTSLTVFTHRTYRAVLMLLQNLAAFLGRPNPRRPLSTSKNRARHGLRSKFA